MIGMCNHLLSIWFRFHETILRRWLDPVTFWNPTAKLPKVSQSQIPASNYDFLRRQNTWKTLRTSWDPPKKRGESLCINQVSFGSPVPPVTWDPMLLWEMTNKRVNLHLPIISWQLICNPVDCHQAYLKSVFSGNLLNILTCILPIELLVMLQHQHHGFSFKSSES